MSPVARADFYNYATTEEDNHALLASSKLAFVGHAEIISMKFLGKDKRVLTPEEVVTAKPFTTDPLFYPPESLVQRIEFTVKLVPEKLLKGEMPEQNYVTFTYGNSLVALCAQHPRTLHKGNRMTFYVTDIVGTEVKSIAYGDVETQEDAEQAGTGQPATRPESKPEGGDKPQPESEGRSR